MTTNINFHETFQPEQTYIAKILELASANYEGDKFQISEETGIPTGDKKGKVEPHIKYANYMGLIEYSLNRGVYKLNLTDLGAEIINQDKYLHEELSLWLLHYCLTRMDLGAPQWSYIVRKINKGFNSEVSTSFVSSSIQKEFSVSSLDASKSVSVVKNSYSSGLFEPLQYLDWDEKLCFNEKSENIQYLYLYAYALLNSWEELYPDKKEITLNELVDALCIGKIFGLNNLDLDSVLSSLADEEIISVNRQLYPVTIIRIDSSSNMIQKLYSKLM